MKIMHDDKKINAMQDQGAENATDISALQEAVGDEDSGLIKAVADLQTDKATLSDVETLLASGDVEDIKADSIVENMTGYSFAEDAELPEGAEITFAGVVKNGNKITFVVALSVLLPESLQAGAIAGRFTIPSYIGEKLIPFTIGGSNYLDVKDTFFAKDGTSGINAKARFLKVSNTTISLSFRWENFQANVQYYGRYECTFLLSDNLVPEE